MADDAYNSQKTPLGTSLNRFATQKIKTAVQNEGKSLPCSVVSVKGSIVKVKFEVTGPYTLPNVVCPHFGPEYVRYPTQPGDKGVVFPADAYLGGVSGLGGGTADLSDLGNLATLVFFPIANANWTATDPKKVVTYGPNGVTLKDTQGRVVVDVDGPSGNITITGNLHVSGAVIAGFGTSDQVGVQTHTHNQGSDSHGDSEQPTNKPNAGT